MTAPVVIVGAGVAGHGVVTSLRSAGAEQPIVMIGDETVQPYDRPAISKAFLQGRKSREELQFSSASRYAELGVELRLGEVVTALDAEAHRVTLASGQDLEYEAVVVATGCRPVALPLPGFDDERIVALRTLDDAARLRERLDDQASVAIIGAGLVGSEAAASARQLGCEVTLIDARSEPLGLVLGPELGGALATLHERNGVALIMDAQVTQLRSDDGGFTIDLRDREAVRADVVLVAVGARANVELFELAGAEVGEGAMVDHRMLSTLADVFAAGDVATWTHPLSERPLRVEHYENAQVQGRAAGIAIAGGEPPPPGLPTFWSDQYDRSILWAGVPGAWDDIVFRGTLDELDVTAFYVTAGKVQAVAAVNRPRDLRHARRLIESGAAVTASQLADPDVDLRTLS